MPVLKTFRYLAGLTYLPRVFAFTMLAVMVLWSEHLSPQLRNWVSLFIFLYPHMSQCWAGFFRLQSPLFARILYVDTVIVVLGSYAAGFEPNVSAAIMICLCMSALLLGGIRVMLTIFAIATTLLLPGYFMLEPVWQLSRLNASALFLLGMFSFIVSYLTREETSRLIKNALAAKDSHSRLTQLTNHLSRYIAPQLYVSLSENAAPTAATARKRLTVCFSDIQGFTELMDNMEEELLTRILNEYLDAMATIALKQGGVVDKFLGDGVMVFFGDPTSRGARRDAVAAVTMALEMRAKLSSLRREWQGQWGVDCPLHIRIGIHSGYCTVGSFGAENRLDYTIIGSNVNLASRLENIAGTDEILISEESWHLTQQEFTGQPREPVMVKGINRPLKTVAIQGFRTGQRELCYSDQGIEVRLSPRLASPASLKKLLSKAISDLQPDSEASPVARILQ